MQPRSCPVDAQSVKNTDTAMHKGYDAGKKVSSIKRHIAVDTQGLPHAVAVSTAEVTDCLGAVQVEAAMGQEPCCVTAAMSASLSCKACVGYLARTSTRKSPNAMNGTASRSFPSVGSWNESFAWREKHRRLSKNGKPELNTSWQFIHMAFPAI